MNVCDMCSALAAAETGDLVGRGGEPLLTAAEQDEGWDPGTQPRAPVSKGDTHVTRNRPSGGCWLKSSAFWFDQRSLILSYLGTFSVQQQPKKTRQDQF